MDLKKYLSRILSILLLLIQGSSPGCIQKYTGDEYFPLCQCRAKSLKLVCNNIQFEGWSLTGYKNCSSEDNDCADKYLKSLVIMEWSLQKHLDADLMNFLPAYYLHLLLNLQITFSNISGIDSGAFSAYTNLQELYLHDNKIEILGLGVFSEQSSLHYLDLSNNKLESIHDGLFLEDKKIITLKLNNNKINYLDDNSFYNLPKVVTIHLGNNKISNISSLLFRRQTALSYLDLSHNFIDMIDKGAFRNVTNLEEIHLQNNRINSIPKGLFQTQEKLGIVNLSNNPIVTYFPLNQIIGHTINLEILYFSNISQSQLILENLNASRVNFFFADNNKISKIPFKAFALTSSLVFIDLGFNHINYVDNNAFGQLFKLLTLKLNNNDIETLFSGTFMFLKALTRLDLSYNKISSLQLGLLDSCSDLSTLVLSHNRLNYVNKFNFVSLKNLKTLQVDNNALTQLDGVSSLPRLQLISLQNNSWKCEELFNLIEKLESKSVTISGTSSKPPIGHHIKQISCDHKNVYFDINEEKPEENLYEKSLKNMSLLFDKLAKNIDKSINESQNMSRFNNEQLLQKYLNQNKIISDHFTNVSSKIFTYLQTAQDNASLSNQRLEAAFASLFQNASLSNIESREDFKSELLTIANYFETMTSSLESISRSNSNYNQEYLKKMNEIADKLAKNMDKFINESQSFSSEIFAFLQNAQYNASLSNQRFKVTFASLFQNASLSNIQSIEKFESGVNLTIEKYFETVKSSLESISRANSGNNQEFLKKINEIVDSLKGTIGKMKNEKTETNNETFSYIFLCIGLCLLIIVGVGVFSMLFKQRNRHEDNENCMLKNISDHSL